MTATVRAWAVADWHFGHANIIGSCGRPFRDTAHMADEIVRRHNALVADDDLVFVLGDISRQPSCLEPVARLRGRKIAVAGNHDAIWAGHRNGPQRQVNMQARYIVAGFDAVIPTGIIPAVTLPSGLNVTMSHLPYDADTNDDRRVERLAPWRPHDLGRVLVCGHVHNLWRERRSAAGSLMINVGVDVRNFEPTALEAIDMIVERHIGATASRGR